jgi:rhamnosyltransferase
MIRVLVLLAAYNGESWLSEQLRSVLTQEEVDVHVVIGEDVSTDKTRELLVKEFQNNPRVDLQFWDKSSGSAGANFRRLYTYAESAGFSFVALADQDDIWLPRKLISAVNAIESSGAHGYSCAVTAVWASGRQKVLSQNPSLRLADFLFEGAGQGCTFVLRANLFKKIQQFHNLHPHATQALHFHDWLVYLLVRVWDLEWHFDKRTWIKYRQHQSNEIGSRGSLKALNRRLNLVKSGWYKSQINAAIDLSELASSPNEEVHSLIQLLKASPSFKRKILLSYRLMKVSRRRVSDRVILALSVLIGWI